MKMTRRRAIWTFVGVFVALIAAWLLRGVYAVMTSPRLKRYKELQQQYQSTVRNLRQQLTPDVLDDLGCEINSMAYPPYGITILPPEDSEHARDFLRILLDYGTFRPWGIAPGDPGQAPVLWECALAYYHGQEGPDHCLLSVAIYGGQPYVAVVRSTSQPRIVVDMDYYVYGEFQRFMGTLECQEEENKKEDKKASSGKRAT